MSGDDIITKAFPILRTMVGKWKDGDYPCITICINNTPEIRRVPDPHIIINKPKLVYAVEWRIYVNKRTHEAKWFLHEIRTMDDNLRAKSWSQNS